MGAFGRNPIVVLVCIAMNLRQQIAWESEDFLVTLRQLLYYDVWELLVALLDHREYLRDLLLWPVGHRVSELDHRLDVSKETSTYFEVYFEARVLGLQRLKVVEEPLLGKSRKTALIFGDNSDFVFRRTTDVGPTKYWCV